MFKFYRNSLLYVVFVQNLISARHYENDQLREFKKVLNLDEIECFFSIEDIWFSHDGAIYCITDSIIHFQILLAPRMFPNLRVFGKDIFPEGYA